MAEDNTPKKLTKTEFKNILKTIEKNVIDTFDLQTHSVFITYLENELKARGYDLSDKTLQKQLDNWAMNNTDFLTARGSQGLLYEDLKNIDNAEGVGFIGLAEGLDEDMNVIANIPDTPTNVVDDYITALKQETSKYKTFDEYEKAFSREYKRGIYYHLTDNPNFVVDLSKGATDAATGKMTPGSIMFTTDLDYWADTTWTDRPYVAILDLSDVDESQFTQVNTGQGNEFYLDNASKVKQSELINQWGLDNLKNKEDLKNVIWDNRLDTPTNVVDDGFPPDQIEGEGPMEGDFGRDAPDEIDYRYELADEEFNKIVNNVNNLVDELPLEETFKNQVKKNTARISKNVATPGGVIDFIDVWELQVLALAVAAISTNEVDEIPTIIYNQGVKMYNSMLFSVGIPGQIQEKPYNINFEKAIKTFNIAEMFMPTAYAEKAAVKEFKKGQEAGVDISVGLGAGAGVPPMQFKGQEPKQDNGDINNIMVNLIKNISNAQKSYPITSSEMSNFNRNPIQVVAQDTADKPVKIEYDSKEKQKINDIYAKLYKNLSNAGARVQ